MSTAPRCFRPALDAVRAPLCAVLEENHLFGWLRCFTSVYSLFSRSLCVIVTSVCFKVVNAN